MIAKDIMTKDVITVSADTRIEEVASILLEKNISGLPVVDGGQKLIGIITEGDLVFQNKKLSPPAMVEILGAIITVGSQEKFFSDLKKTLAFNVGDLMVKNVVTVTADTRLEDIISKMLSNNVNRVPVVDGDRLIGIITRQDMIRAKHSNTEQG